jgi:sialic acid synthase SpsE
MTLREIIENYRPYKPLIQRPYIIAEAGVNHEGNMDLARRLIDEAKEGGADAIKFQTYKANTIASKDSPSYWDLSKESTDSQYKLFQKYDKFWKSEYEILARHCEQIDIEFLSTPFDVESARFLNDIMGVFKISSSDMNNKPFIDYLCGFGKPIILSTGASYMWEVEQSVSWIEKNGNSLALLHCILNYPTDDANANLAMIQALGRKFPDNIIGYSDHTLPKDMKTLEVATLLGARIIEKHFSHDKSLPGNDHYHAMDKEDLKNFHHCVGRLLELLGDPHRRPLPSEEISRENARRSLVAARRIPAGKTIEEIDLTWKRPGRGIDPRDYSHVIGRVTLVEIEEDAVITWGLIGD